VLRPRWLPAPDDPLRAPAHPALYRHARSVLRAGRRLELALALRRRQAEIAIDGWRTREAKSGRLYACGSQTIGGYPFRIEVNCDKASALFRSNQPPVEVKASGMLIAAQVYQPNLLITNSTARSPVAIRAMRRISSSTGSWRSRACAARRRARAVSLVFDRPVVERVSGGNRQNVLRAKHIEIHGRIVEGSAASKPVIEMVLRLTAATAPELHPAASQPIDADITAVLYGLNDFGPKPWPMRFARFRSRVAHRHHAGAGAQGDTIAVGTGTLSLNANGRLEGQLRVTVAEIEPFLATIGRSKWCRPRRPWTSSPARSTAWPPASAMSRASRPPAPISPSASIYSESRPRWKASAR